MNESITRLLVERIRALSKPMDPQPTGCAPRLQRLTGIRAILFDLYGTLFLSASGEMEEAEMMERKGVFRDSLAAAGFQGDLDKAATAGLSLLHRQLLRSHDQSRRMGVEYPEADARWVWGNVIEQLMGEKLLTEKFTADQLWRVIVEYQCRINPIWPAPGLEPTLRALRRNKIILGLVSNAQFYTPLQVQALLGMDLVDLGFLPELCVWSYQGREAKPSARLVRRALDQLRSGQGVEPWETLFVGNDMLNDILPAFSAGCRTALYAGDARSLRRRENDPRCAGLVPDLTLVDIRQLTEAVHGPG